MSAATRWHLLRHAPAAVAKGTIYGRTDVSAEPQDPAVLNRIAARLPTDATLVTTPLRRTAETAEMLRSAGWVASAETIEPAFREQDFGAWEGRTHAGLAEGGSPDYAAFWDDPARNRPPGGESFADLAARVAPALAGLNATHAGRDIVVIGHGGSIRAILSVVLKLTPEVALSLDIAPLSLSLADHFAGTGALPPWRLRGINLPPDN
ncbi:histidine phosphatase family protein [Nisaea acidiphila]|uniref:Histidine phosphatase family protein n=1 Tax=Nisaea acidiphila TaxID=1862145 RepID=A0A9J7AXP9_9PROT|nr:histidine phosphatase family protein [Nisaea acidiphila]UUX52064.1 histidine phosphatase family protein [Nisaea acidiphila]